MTRTLSEFKNRHMVKLRRSLKNGVEVPAHGTAEMPIWGSTFADIKTHRVVTMRVTELIQYLESVQTK